MLNFDRKTHYRALACRLVKLGMPNEGHVIDDCLDHIDRLEKLLKPLEEIRDNIVQNSNCSPLVEYLLTQPTKKT